MKREFGPIISNNEHFQLRLHKIPYTGWVLYGYEDESLMYEFRVSSVLHNEFGPGEEARGSKFYWLHGKYIGSKREYLIKVSRLGKALYG